MQGNRIAQLLIIAFALLLCCIVGGLIATFYFNQAPAGGPVTISGADVSEPEAVVVSGAAGTGRYAIVPAETTASFTLTEELRGQPTTVVGEGSDVSGIIFLDIADPAAATVGAITVDTATLATDISSRNRAIQTFILQTGLYPTITFVPQTISGLPSTLVVGDTVELVLTGDLTIRDVTQPVDFTAAVTLISLTRLAGTATTVINRDDFGLAIPSVPHVANVSQAVTLSIDFVADES